MVADYPWPVSAASDERSGQAETGVLRLVRGARAGYVLSMTDIPTKDSNGNVLADGDSVTLIKDLKVKGSGGVTLKRGTLVKNIRLTDDEAEIEANVDKVRGLVLRTEFVRKA
jgi:protein PhnA